MSTSYHVYGNTGAGDPVDYSTVLATVAGTAWAYPTPAPGTTWTYAVRAVDTVSLLEETNVDAVTTIVTDASGVDVSLVPIAPMLLTLVPAAGGTVRAHWAYPVGAARQTWKPTAFHVYAGTGTAELGAPGSYAPPDYFAPDYFAPGYYGGTGAAPFTPSLGSMVATVPYTSASPSFSTVLGPYADGTVVDVIVRAFNAAGEEGNTNVVTCTAMAAGPLPADGLTAAATAQAGTGA